MDFHPFLQGFQSMDNYIKNLITDINNPTYFQRLIAPFCDSQVTPLSTHDTIRTFLSSPACQSHPHACKAKMKFEQFCIEINYVYKVFHAIYNYFQILSTFSYDFLLAISQLTPYGGKLKQLTSYEYISILVHLIIDLK